MTLIQIIDDAMRNDDEDQSERLQHLYEDANPEEKELLDQVFICLSGWTLKTLIDRAKATE